MTTMGKTNDRIHVEKDSLYQKWNVSKCNKLIYFVFWFKLSNITFFLKIKILTWHIKMLNNIFLIIF